MAKESDIKQGPPLQKAGSPSDIDIYEDMERIFDKFFTHGWLRPWRMEWPALGEPSRPFAGRMPRTDVIDRDSEILVRAELPGVNKKDIDLSLSDDSVTIKAHTRHEEKVEKENYCRSEISRGEFMRTISLPAVVDSTKAKATFKDGLLEVVMPKIEVRKRRNISIE
jgi:HSP20 family protein